MFFVATITNIDTVDYGGGLDHSTLQSPVIGPVHLDLSGGSAGNAGSTCIADLFQANYGCLPPVGNVYIGHFKVSVPLPDLNHDNIGDQLNFTLAAHSVGNVTQTSIQGANIVDTFNSTANLNGGVGNPGDPNADPPFGPILLSGPTTAQQQIVVAAAPEPGTWMLLGSGLLFAVIRRRRA